MRIFAHQGRHVAPIGVKVGLEEGDPKVPLLQAKFHSIGATVRVYGPKKTKFLLRFDQNVEFKRPAGAYPLPYFSAHVCAMSIVAKRSPISATAELLF